MHIPVLLHESISSLDIHPGDTIIDGTFGGGGHSGEIIARYGTSVHLVCVDLDEAAKVRYDEAFSTITNAQFVQANFKDVDSILSAIGKESVNKVLLDLGTSTFQLLQDTRGFSFHSDTPLSMSFSEKGSHTGFDAYTIVNNWDESSIADIIYGYGEERSARKIARAIKEARELAPIATSGQLAAVIEHVIPRRGRSHPATKTFQALRIAVNDELGTITAALNGWWNVIVPGGRIVVITFHSLEDRIVKHWMRDQTQKRVITKKPIIASREELQANPRARSAKLRCIEKDILS
jgi:16S rRNA (cytosine1402-N4)-methyltransferase